MVNALMQCTNKILKSAFFIVLITLLCKVFGFCRELTLAKYFGTGQIVDIYLMSIAIPSILFGFLPAIGVGITAIFFKIKENLRNALISTTILISICVALFCIIFTYVEVNNIVYLCARGFDENAQITTARFLRITIWSIILIAPIQILIAFLNCNKKYVHSNISNLIISIGQIIGIIVAYHNIKLLPFAYVLPLCVQLLLLFYFSFQNNFRLSIKRDIDGYLKKLCILTFPIFLSNVLVDINGFVNKYFASGLLRGCIAALNYAFILQTVFFTVCSAVISTLFYPRISELVASNNNQKLAQEIHFVHNVVILVCIPISIISIVYAEEIIKVVYMRGHFSAESLGLTKTPFAVYSVSLVFIVLRDLIIKVLYAYSDTKSNTIYSILAIFINILVSIILVKPLGHVGLACGTTLSTIITMPLYFRKMSHIVCSYCVKNSMKTMKKIFVASFLMGSFALLFKYIQGFMSIESRSLSVIIFFANISILLLIYISVLKFFKLYELEIFIKYIKESL